MSRFCGRGYYPNESSGNSRRQNGLVIQINLNRKSDTETKAKCRSLTQGLTQSCNVSRWASPQENTWLQHSQQTKAKCRFGYFQHGHGSLFDGFIKNPPSPECWTVNIGRSIPELQTESEQTPTNLIQLSQLSVVLSGVPLRRNCQSYTNHNKRSDFRFWRTK